MGPSGKLVIKPRQPVIQAVISLKSSLRIGSLQFMIVSVIIVVAIIFSPFILVR